MGERLPLHTAAVPAKMRQCMPPFCRSGDSSSCHRRRFLPTVELAIVFLLLIACTGPSGALASTKAVNRRRLEGDSAIVGGYRPLANATDDLEALEVAKYVAAHLDDPDMDGTSSGLSSVTDDPTSVRVTIVRGYSQVVAGTNYRLLLLFVRGSNATNDGAPDDNTTLTADCAGAVAVEVYARFDGTLNITAWGETVSCDRALQLWKDPTADYGADHDDFSSSSPTASGAGASLSQGTSSGATVTRGLLAITDHPALATLASMGLSFVVERVIVWLA